MKTIFIRSVYSPVFIPNLIKVFSSTFLAKASCVAVGVGLLTGLAQISMPLPWTPVPVTGQTFGVLLISLLWGRRLAPLTVFSYLMLGGMGLPVFAQAKAGFVWGPTVGYLIGMMVSSVVVGQVAELGFGKSFWRCWLSGILGSAVTFGCGLYVLSHFVPKETLLMAGFWPFLPGDLIKTTLAAAIASRLNRIQLQSEADVIGR